MKCIYCNCEENITESDIIPWAITGAKVKRKFVCNKHNAFTNENYEKYFIDELKYFRNQLGLTERNGNPIKFKGDLFIDGCVAKDMNISNREFIMDNKKCKFRAIDEKGKTAIIGNSDEILKIKGATAENIRQLNVSDMEVQVKFDLKKIFCSTETQHVIAKIAYEWHCFINNIEEYDEKSYKEIVSFILNPDSTTHLVEIVTDNRIWSLADNYLRTGTNSLFEYDDEDGGEYVIFCLWGVIIYKVKIREHCRKKVENLLHKMYLYHLDGTCDIAFWGCTGQLSVKSEDVNDGFLKIFSEVKVRLSKLNDRDITYKYLVRHVERIKKMLPAYKCGKCTFEKMIGYEEEDLIIALIILEKLYLGRGEYISENTFEENLLRMNQKNLISIDKQKKKEILLRYKEKDKAGILYDDLYNQIEFFNQCGLKTSND